MRLIPTVGLAAVVAATVVGAPSAGAQQPSLGRVIRDTTLANGLQVYVIENHALPIMTAVLAVRGGAMTQDSGTAGVYNLSLNTPRVDLRNIGTAIVSSHAVLSARTETEFGEHIVSAPAAQYADAVSLLGWMVAAPDYDYDALKRGQIVVASQFQRELANPEGQLRRAIEAKLWSTAWARKDVLGQPNALYAATSQALKALHRTYYVPNNTALIVSGDVTAAQAFQAARHTFDRWPRGPDPFASAPVPPVPPLASTQAVIQTGFVQDVTVMMAWQGPSTGQTPDLTCAADVFTTMFNDPAGRAQRYLVESGLFQELSISYLTQHHVGRIEIVGRTTVDSVSRALVSLKRELAAFDQPTAFDDAALASGQQSRRVGAAMTEDRPTAAAAVYAFWWASAGADYYRNYLDHVQAVTIPDLRAYVHGYLDQPYVIGVLGPDNAYPSLALAFQAFVNDSASATGPAK